MPPLGLYLLVLVAAAASIRDRVILRVALALLLNWLANTAFAFATGNPFNWIVLFVVDMVTATVLLDVCVGSRLACLIGASYVIEMMAHMGFGLSSKGVWAQWRYWWFLCDLAILQAAIVTAPIVHGGLRMARRRSDAARSALVDPPVHASVAKSKDRR